MFNFLSKIDIVLTRAKPASSFRQTACFLSLFPITLLSLSVTPPPPSIHLQDPGDVCLSIPQFLSVKGSHAEFRAFSRHQTQTTFCSYNEPFCRSNTFHLHRSIQAVHVYQLKILCAKVFLSHFTLKRLILSSQGVNMPGGSTCLIWPSFCLVTCLQLESNQNPFTHQANALTVLVYSMKGYLLLPYLCLNIISEYCTFVAF